MTGCPDWTTIGKRIASARQQKGLSKADAARVCGVSVQTIRRWEAGGKFHTPSMRKISKGLDLSTDWLLMGYGPMKRGAPWTAAQRREMHGSEA